MAGNITRTYTFTNNTNADASQVESEISNIVTVHNQLDAGTTSWTTVKAASGTFTGAVAMGSNKVTGLASGTASSDAASYGQLIGMVGPYVTNLRISSGGTVNVIHLFWDDVVLEDASSNKVRNQLIGAGASLNITTSGTNGIDTGSVQASKWYYVWIISNGTTFSGLLSLSQTAPTMPAGYTYKLMVGVVQTDGSSVLIKTLQIGKKLSYWDNQVVVNNDSTHHNAVVTTDVTAFIPPTICWKVNFYMVHVATFSVSAQHGFVLYLSGINPSAPAQFVQQQWTTTIFKLTGTQEVLLVNEPPTAVSLYWQVDEDTTNLSSFGTWLYVKDFYLTSIPAFD